MNKLSLFFFLIGLLFIFVGTSNPSKVQVQNSEKVKSSKAVQISPLPAPTSQRGEQSSSPKQVSSQVQVVRVIDGDTIDVQINDKEEKIRLIGINAPETNECFGKEATDKAKSLLSSKSVNLEIDSTQDDRDKYHRLLRYVFVDGINFDELMVREGFAKEYTYHIPYKYQSEFKSAEREARESKKGLWADGVCSNLVAEPKSSESVQYKVQGSYICDCSKLCSQISTCDEAYFQLKNCGCSKRDSDHDGIPCESICK